MKLGVFGAGAIGCYVGGRLRAASVDVALVGRASVAHEIARHGRGGTTRGQAPSALRSPVRP